jgi:hypothetical protein
MHMEDLDVRKVIQIIPSTSLWLRHVTVRGEPRTSAEFEPVVAIALVEVSAPHDRLFLSEGLLPIGCSEMMWGLVEQFPLERMRAERSIFHDVDFDVRGSRLKQNAIARATHNYTWKTGIDFARFVFSRERDEAGESANNLDMPAMAMQAPVSRDYHVKRIIELVPSSGLWLSRAKGQPGPQFMPIVAMAHAEISEPRGPLLLADAFFPITSDDLMRGLLERCPNRGLRVEKNVFHDVDFEELGFRLKANSIARSWYQYARADEIDFTAHVRMRAQLHDAEAQQREP